MLRRPLFTNNEKMGVFQCNDEIPVFVAAAAKAGWDSLQFTRHCDAFCHDGKMGAALDGSDVA